MKGFKVKPPQGSGWYYDMGPDNRSVMFLKKHGKDQEHSYLAVAELDYHWKSTSDLNELESVVRRNPAEDKRAKVFDAQIKQTKFRHYDAILCQFMAEVHGLTLKGYSYYLPHPVAKDGYVLLHYSQRYPKGELYSKSIDQEVKLFFDSFEFKNLENQWALCI